MGPQRDEEGRKFSLVLWDGDRPDRVLTIDRGAGVATTTLLDEHLRPELVWGG